MDILKILAAHEKMALTERPRTILVDGLLL